MRKTQIEHQIELIDGLAQARQAILHQAGQVPPDQRDLPFLGEWCLKDLLAHMIGWDFTNLQAIQEILAGQRPQFFQAYDKDWHSYNASLVAAYRIEPFEALLEAVAVSHARLLAFLRSRSACEILEGKVTGAAGRTVTIRNLLRAQASDEMEHARQVEAFVQQLSRAAL